MSSSAAKGLLFVGIIVGVCLSTGIILMVSALLTHGLKANPYIALTVFLASFALLATALTAIRERARRSREKDEPSAA
jgi:membrane protein implicated in regulation of membrane protease activity